MSFNNTIWGNFWKKSKHVSNSNALAWLLIYFCWKSSTLFLLPPNYKYPEYIVSIFNQFSVEQTRASFPENGTSHTRQEGVLFKSTNIGSRYIAFLSLVLCNYEYWLGLNWKQLLVCCFCLLDESMSGEAMSGEALNVVNKTNNKLKFHYLKNSFLTPALRRLLCNALIQPHFDYACSAWYPNETKKLKHRIQTTQNKYMRFCLQFDKLKHIWWRVWMLKLVTCDL